MTAPDLADFIDQYHQALDEFFRGDPAPAKGLYSHREDVSLANPFGPVVVGWRASRRNDGAGRVELPRRRRARVETLASHATPELAYLVEVERFEARVGGEQQMASGALRVTSILRPEDGVWKIVHRHADPITASRTADSVIQR